jgi:hypothetical protein
MQRREQYSSLLFFADFIDRQSFSKVFFWLYLLNEDGSVALAHASGGFTASRGSFVQDYAGKSCRRAGGGKTIAPGSRP